MDLLENTTPDCVLGTAVPNANKPRLEDAYPFTSPRRREWLNLIQIIIESFLFHSCRDNNFFISPCIFAYHRSLKLFCPTDASEEFGFSS